MNDSEVICNNCGRMGHMYRECRKPVLSYGVLLFDTRSKTDPKILMVQRKDSLCYIEFLRGKYDITQREYIMILLNKCSVEERGRLVSEDYDTLWKALWGVTQIENKMRFRSDYERGKSKYEILSKGYTCLQTGQHVSLSSLIHNTTKNYPSSEWEFPKGRRNQGETNKQCAVREFQEETGYEPDDYSLLLNVKPFEEEYMGENRVRYKHVYYIGYLKNYQKDYSVDHTNSHQVSEIRDIRWFTKSDALGHLRDYHHTRFKVVRQIFDLLDGLDTKFYIVDTI